MREHLHPKQLECVDKFIPNIQKGIGCIAWWTMGEGKSRIALAIYNDLKFNHRGICLIVCRRKAFGTWREEIRKVKFPAMVQEFPPPSGQTSQVSSYRHTVWLVSHAMLHKILNRIKNFPIHLVVFDELYLYSNHRSKRTIAASKITNVANGRVVGLSGTIMPAKDTLSIWGQARALGISEWLASTVTNFYETYKRSFLVDYGRGSINQWSDKPKAKEQILEKLGPYIHVYFPKSKREIEETFHEFPLTKQQEKVIRLLKDEYYFSDEEEDFELELRSALEIIIKVSQIANGWCKDKAGNFIYFPSNKLDALCANLEEAHANNIQRIVWCHFRHDLKVIQDNLDFETLKMSGSHEFDIDKWESGKFPIVLATMGSGSSVNYFKHVQHASIFSKTFKHLDYSQSMARTNRFDSAHSSCSYAHYHCKATFDRHVYSVLKSTGNVEREFIKQGILKQWLQLPAS